MAVTWQDSSNVVACCSKIMALHTYSAQRTRKRAGAKAIGALIRAIRAQQSDETLYVQEKACQAPHI